ncbi:Lysophospholipase L1 [Parapedobacter luteus]|uniref:Lysophospholipase L1 n=1 Tax=Parapedobacter luteus TaxID=623280 RepID=A0A1T5CFW0_9SPHI|nr:rhamnogalacturonan acetylesterase [Parapedobacter luteus]SKB58365.1 Lysophospholipase L1 [Parapedobacter luteus]
MMIQRLAKWIVMPCAGLFLAFLWAGQREVTVFLVGDSTVANKPYRASNPEKGWGQVLPLYFDEGVRVENHALNGRSTKSFRNEGHWDKVKARVQRGDYVVIAFGHNDQKENSPERYADPEVEFPRQLKRYIAETRERGGIPVLSTPIMRRKFDVRGYLEETHGAYPEVVRNVASETGVALLDMHAQTRELLLEWGPERSKALFLHLMPGQYEALPNGAEDDTHLSGTGAFKICDLAVAEMKRCLPALAAHFKR